MAIVDVNDVHGQELASRLGSGASYHHCDVSYVLAESFPSLRMRQSDPVLCTGLPATLISKVS